jgi:hypothetical protein
MQTRPSDRAPDAQFVVHNAPAEPAEPAIETASVRADMTFRAAEIFIARSLTD